MNSGMNNDRMKASFEKYRSLDPSLTEEEFEKFNPHYVILQEWQMEYEDEFILNVLKMARAELHRRTYLEKFDASSWNAGRCYTRGIEKWRRKDGQPMTAEDREALRYASYGQIVGVQGEIGDNFLVVNWSRDSSD